MLQVQVTSDKLQQIAKNCGKLRQIAYVGRLAAETLTFAADKRCLDF